MSDYAEAIPRAAPWLSTYKLPTGRKPWKLHRTIGDDESLVHGMLQEIDRRILGPPQRIAVVAEWDTAYGRDWERTFKKVLGTGGDFSDWPVTLDSYTYLRGLDGWVAGAASSASSAKQQADEKWVEARSTER